MPLTLANMSPWGKCGGEEVMERVTAGSCYDHWSKREYQSNTNVLLNHLVITLTGCTKNCRAGVSYYQLTYVAPAYNPIFPFSPLPDYQTLLKWACFLAMPFFFFFGKAKSLMFKSIWTHDLSLSIWPSVKIWYSQQWYLCTSKNIFTLCKESSCHISVCFQRAKQVSCLP